MLTEEQLLASSEDEYMNKEQLAFFRHRLETMRDEILENLAKTNQHLKEATVEIDENDRASLEEEHWLELRIRERETKLLKKINEALQRIDSEDYGYCEDTGDAIGIPRLLARPTATLSTDAQEQREQRQRVSDTDKF